MEWLPMASYLGSGIGFPIKTSITGALQLSAAGQNLEESIHVILRTSVGERLYRPDFGSRLSELVFAPLNTNTLLLLRLYIEEALEAWEPRIELDEILTDPDPVHGRVDITIHYHPKGSHDSRSLVYPFYLLPADEAL
jgi:phage baseplate assembly protein W